MAYNVSLDAQMPRSFSFPLTNVPPLNPDAKIIDSLIGNKRSIIFAMPTGSEAPQKTLFTISPKKQSSPMPLNNLIIIPRKTVSDPITIAPAKQRIDSIQTPGLTPSQFNHMINEVDDHKFALEQFKARRMSEENAKHWSEYNEVSNRFHSILNKTTDLEESKTSSELYKHQLSQIITELLTLRDKNLTDEKLHQTINESINDVTFQLNCDWN